MSRLVDWARTHPTVLSVVFFSGLAFAGFRDVREQQDRLEETRSKVLCPLYAVFLQSDTPEARARAADPEVYDAALDVIRAGAETLHCE